MEDCKLSGQREPTSGSSGSDGERKRKKGRRRDRERSEKRKKEEARRKEKRKRRKQRQRSREDSGSSGEEEEERRKKRKLLKEAKRIIKRHKKNRDGTSGGDGNQKSTSRKVLSEEDYYEKNKEFSAWLKEDHGIYFSSLSSDDTRRLFVDFVQAWNAGKLSEKLYSGINQAARTDHKWQFKSEKELSIDKNEELEFMKKLERSQRKKFRKEHDDLIDELLPKATGKERLLEKRSIRKEQAFLREESPEILREQDMMGGGDDFKQRVGKERARREKKTMERSEALKEKQLVLEQKESVAMDQFRTLVNVAGGKITIPKRMDPT